MMKWELEKKAEVDRGVTQVGAEESCPECGKKMKKFMHNCPSSSEYPEIYGCPVHDDVCPFCSGEGKTADKEETPPAAYQTYKIKPKDIDVPPSVEPGSKTLEQLLQVVHKAEESKTNLQVAIEKATQEIEKAMNLGDIDRKEQEALDQLATLLDAQKDKIVSIGSWLVALRDQIKVKKGKLTPSEKVNKLLEKFEGAEQFLKNVEAQVKDEQTRIREIVEFPKKESSMQAVAGVGGWFKGLLDKMSGWLDDLISAEGLLEDADQILEGV